MGAIYDNLAYLDDCGDLEFGGVLLLVLCIFPP
jgi:hypothetical protein